MGRRKGAAKLPRDLYYRPYDEAHPVARAIATGSHWFDAWCFQYALTWPRLKRATGITPARAMQIARGAPIAPAELVDLAKACGVQPPDIIASLPDAALLGD